MRRRIKTMFDDLGGGVPVGRLGDVLAKIPEADRGRVLLEELPGTWSGYHVHRFSSSDEAERWLLQRQLEPNCRWSRPPSWEAIR